MIDRDLLLRMAVDATGPGFEHGRLRLLVVEDEGLVALEIEAALTDAGHDVLGVADDQASTIDFIRHARMRPELALVDIRLASGSSGLDVAAELAVLGVPVLFVTGNCPAERGRSMALGCLHKPFTDAELVASVAVANAVIHGRQPVHVPTAMHLY